MKPKKNLDSLITKVTSPFSVVPDFRNNESSKISESDETPSSSNRKNDRDSVDVWRASDLEKESDNKFAWNENDNLTRDDILNQWLGSDKRDNNTIIEDVEAENAEDQSRYSKYSNISATHTQRDSQFDDV